MNNPEDREERPMLIDCPYCWGNGFMGFDCGRCGEVNDGTCDRGGCEPEERWGCDGTGEIEEDEV